MTNNRRKTLPPIDPATDRKLRPILEALKEIQETGEGVRGDPLDRKLTVRDLVEAGLARLRPGSQTDIGPVENDPIDNDPPGSMLIPPRPTGFNAVGSFGYIVLSWDIPGDLYANHAFTNIYRSETDNFANAVMIGRDTGMMYTDHIREVVEHGVGFYYWITFTNTDGVEGPANAASGTYAEVIPDLGFLMDRLSSEIDDSKLAQSFLERLPGYQETVSESGDIYTLTLNQDGYISGLGAYNDGSTSDFTIIADRFWVAPPGSTGRRKPFIIQDGNVYIDTAFIREASIQEGQLGPISFGKITDSSGNPVTTVAGKLKGELVEAENLRVAEAAKFYGNVFSNNYQQGVSGWAIRQDGTVEFNEGLYRGPVEFHNVTGAGALASKDALYYNEVSGTKPPTDADKTGDNTAYDTARVDGTSASTVRQRADDGYNANNRVNNWVKPGYTLIDGNKIYTGDAYVDTLQIKGQAVTVSDAAYGESAISVGNTPSTRDVLVIDGFSQDGADIFVLGTVCYEASDSASGGGTLVAQAYLELRVVVDYSVKRTTVIADLLESDGVPSDSVGEVSVHSESTAVIGYRIPGQSGSRRIRIQAYMRNCELKHRYLQVMGVKR